jgi:hypothetical protein
VAEEIAHHEPGHDQQQVATDHKADEVTRTPCLGRSGQESFGERSRVVPFRSHLGAKRQMHDARLIEPVCGSARATDALAGGKRFSGFQVSPRDLIRIS